MSSGVGVRRACAPSPLLPRARREEERAVLRADQRRDLGHDQPRDLVEVALALHEAGDAGEVGVQPVLLRVALGRRAEVLDHLVDDVLQLGDLAGGLDGDLPRQVALGHGGGHVLDRSHLGGQVACELVHRLGQAAPGAGHAGDLGLAAQLALGAHLLRDAGDLRRERRELVDHAVDGVGERGDLAAGLDGDLLRRGRRWRPRS